MNGKISALVFAVLALALLSISGCVTPVDEQKNFDALAKLQTTYLVKTGFSSNLSTMSDYINLLSELKSKTSGSAGKVIEAELYSAQTFYYYNKALVDSTSIDYQKMSCSSTATKSTISSITLANDYATKATTALSGLFENEKDKLRANQLETVKGYAEQITQIQKFFADKC
ncbi:MAG: hypothetical protein WC821_01860 [archaeon]|jgi:hypothetical protein